MVLFLLKKKKILACLPSFSETKGELSTGTAREISIVKPRVQCITHHKLREVFIFLQGDFVPQQG